MWQLSLITTYRSAATLTKKLWHITEIDDETVLLTAALRGRISMITMEVALNTTNTMELIIRRMVRHLEADSIMITYMQLPMAGSPQQSGLARQVVRKLESRTISMLVLAVYRLRFTTSASLGSLAVFILCTGTCRL